MYGVDGEGIRMHPAYGVVYDARMWPSNRKKPIVPGFGMASKHKITACSAIKFRHSLRYVSLFSHRP